MDTRRALLALPRPGSSVSLSIDPASGIAVAPEGQGRLLTYFEGNRYGASNIVTWADRCSVAAGRLLQRYPTIARRSVPSDELTVVGSLDIAEGTVTLGHGDVGEDVAGDLLREWLGLPASANLDVELAMSFRPADRVTRTSLRHPGRAHGRLAREGAADPLMQRPDDAGPSDEGPGGAGFETGREQR